MLGAINPISFFYSTNKAVKPVEEKGVKLSKQDLKELNRMGISHICQQVESDHHIDQELLKSLQEKVIKILAENFDNFSEGLKIEANEEEIYLESPELLELGLAINKEKGKLGLLIIDISLQDELRNQGLGTKILNLLESVAKDLKLDHIKIDLSTNNPFWKKLGFTQNYNILETLGVEPFNSLSEINRDDMKSGITGVFTKKI
jgi:N-acetylglutamate synthase-like GNAT family acetyltransferase